MASPSAAVQLEMLERMITIRAVEQRLSQVNVEGKVPGSLDLCVGQEAVAVGACAALRKEDAITSTHRGHGHMIAKGAELRSFMAEIFGRATGYCGGKAGSLHMTSAEWRFYGNGIVGGGIPLATGIAFANKTLRNHAIGLAFFGDGAAQQGQFHESLNIASLWKLPVVFLCENNKYAVSTRSEDASATRTVCERATAYAMPGVLVDGNDVLAVFDAVSAAVERARNGDGPTLIEAETYRVSPQVEGEERVLATTGAYRSADEVEAWKRPERDPIARFEGRLRELRLLGDDAAQTMRERVDANVEDALQFALSSPFPEETRALTGVFADGAHADA